MLELSEGEIEMTKIEAKDFRQGQKDGAVWLTYNAKATADERNAFIANYRAKYGDAAAQGFMAA
jgi:hypothetical protein